MASISESPSIRLAQDVIDIIMKQVPTKDLARCSLISRDWLPAARRRLFELITLKADEDFTSKFIEGADDDHSDESEDEVKSGTMDSSSKDELEPLHLAFLQMLGAFTKLVESQNGAFHIASSIRTLRVVGSWESEEKGFYHVEARLLRRLVAALPRLSTLHLTELNIHHHHVVPTLEPERALRTLILDDVGTLGYLVPHHFPAEDILCLFTMFPSLQALDFCSDDIRCDEVSLHQCLATSALSSIRHRQRQLEFSPHTGVTDASRVGYGFLTSLIRATSKTALHLDVDMVFPEGSLGWPYDLLKGIGHQLESVVLRVWWEGCEFIDEVEEEEWEAMKSGLSYCTSLRAVTLDFVTCDAEGIMPSHPTPEVMRLIFRELFDKKSHHDISVTLITYISDYNGMLEDLDSFGLDYLDRGFKGLTVLASEESGFG